MITILEGKVGIVTGAAQGIGEGIARVLARAGARVVLADLQLEKAEQVANDIGEAAVADYLDVTDPALARAVADRTVDRFGRIDFLVNNAGMDAPSGLPWEIDEEYWRKVIDVNLSGQWWCTAAVMPVMMRQGSGRIIYISSNSARVGDKGAMVAYNASKAGLVGLTIGLASNLEQLGILVNAIAPGPTGTGNVTRDPDSPGFKDEVPLGFGGTDPVAFACLYLIGQGGDWVSGTVLNVSGGVLKG